MRIHEKVFESNTWRFLLWLLTPTYRIATILKHRSKRRRREFILTWHRFFKQLNLQA